MSTPCPVFGFRVLIQPSASTSEADAAAMATELSALLDANGLATAGGSARSDAVGGVCEYVVTRDGSQATDMDRTLVRDWAARWQDRAAIQIGDLIDLQEVRD